MQVDAHQEKKKKEKRPTLKPQWKFEIHYIPTGDVISHSL